MIMARGVREGAAFHKSDDTYVSYTRKFIERSIENGKVTKEDARLIQQYLSEISAETGISGVRKYKIAIQLVGLRRFLPVFTEATAPDLYTAIEDIRIAKKDDGSPMFKPNTIADMIRFMKRFYLWLIENEFSRIPQAKVSKKIKPPAYDRMTKTADQLLEEDEVRRMIEASRTPRDRALISVLYESGCRIGELGELTWKDVRFTENQTAALNTSGKTGKPRYVPLVSSRSYLAAWKADYPGKPDPDKPVFVTNNTHGPLQYAGVVKQLRVIADRAGIEKHVTPHLFRHSRITHLLRKGVPESIIKKIMWGSLTTGMLATYGHLVSADIDDAIGAMYGIKTGEREKINDLEPRQCPLCFSVWGPTLSRCGHCGAPLTPEAVATAEGMQIDIAAHPAALQRMIDERIQEMKRNGEI